MAVDFFLKIDGIKGESTDEKNKEEIQVLSWSWGESNPTSQATGGGLSSGKVNMQDFNFTYNAGAASCDLMQYCAQGKHIPKVVLTCRKATGADAPQEPYYVFTFEDAMISSVQTGGSDGSDGIIEQCSIAFTKIKTAYSKQDEKGIMANAGNFGFDLKVNKKAA